MNSWSNCSCEVFFVDESVFAACPTFLGSCSEKHKRGGGGGSVGMVGIMQNAIRVWQAANDIYFCPPYCNWFKFNIRQVHDLYHDGLV